MKNDSENDIRKKHLIQNVLLILLPILIIATLFFTSTAKRRRHREEPQAPDREPPTIHLTRDKNYFVMPGEQYEEEGYAAYDDRDGDLTKKVESSINGDMVRYRVMDEAGNITVRFRRIPYADSSLLNDQEEWDRIRRGTSGQTGSDKKASGPADSAGKGDGDKSESEKSESEKNESEKSGSEKPESERIESKGPGSEENESD